MCSNMILTKESNGFIDQWINSYAQRQIKLQLGLDTSKPDCCTVKQPLKDRQTKILMTNGSLMKTESIAECSPWSFLQYFHLH